MATIQVFARTSALGGREGTHGTAFVALPWDLVARGRVACNS